MAYTDIDDPTAYFNTKLIPSASEITSVGHQADMIWLKSRTNAYSSELIDTVRGIDKKLKVDDTSGESTTSTVITAIGSDSYTVGSGSNAVYSGSSGVGWSWKAGTSFTNDASSTGIGTIDSTGSVNTDAGFSIVSYTGTGSAATVGHGLGAVPKMIITKGRSFADDWLIWHKSIGTNILELNENGASQSGSSYINGTVPTSSVFSISTSGDINASGGTYIAYLFGNTSISKMGTFTGNGSTSNFVYTGFKPNWVMLKWAGGSEGWSVYDTSRNPINGPNDSWFIVDGVSAENSNTDDLDMLSNGFHLNRSHDRANGSGESYIYAAFAESPLVTSGGVPATAQ